MLLDSIAIAGDHFLITFTSDHTGRTIFRTMNIMRYTDQADFHPNYYYRDRLAMLMRLLKLEEPFERAAKLEGRKKRRAEAKGDAAFRLDAGTVHGEDLVARKELLEGFDILFRVWERGGSIIADISCRLEDTIPSVGPELPRFSSDPLHHIYIHLGKQPGLELKGLPGGCVEGVYVTSAEPEDNDAVMLLAAVCRRGGPLRSADRLEKHYLNQSAMVLTCYAAGELSLIGGDKEMINDPAIELAQRIALQSYAETVARFEPAFEALSSLRSRSS